MKTLHLSVIIALLILMSAFLPQPVRAGLINCNTNYYGSFGSTTNCSTFGDYSYSRPAASYPVYTSNYDPYSHLSALLKLYELEANSKEQQKKLAEEITTKVDERFKEVYGKPPTDAEINYWAIRMYKEKFTSPELRNKMIYYKSLGKTMGESGGPAVAGAKTVAKDAIPNKDVPAIVSRLFSQVYGHNITPSESAYWKNRARTDKTTEAALMGAMAYHKAKGVQH